MTAKASAAILFVALGVTVAIAATGAPADPPMGSAPTVYRTVTEKVNRQVDGHTVGWWRQKAVHNRREANARRITLQRIRRVVHARWEPTTSYAIKLASTIYGVPEEEMRSVAWCESRFFPFAVNGQYRGLFQEGPMFDRGPFAAFSVYDPLANALTAARTVAREGWGQWSCKP